MTDAAAQAVRHKPGQRESARARQSIQGRVIHSRECVREWQGVGGGGGGRGRVGVRVRVGVSGRVRMRVRKRG